MKIFRSVFQLVRRFASTADPYYLDFEKVFCAFDANADGIIDEDDMLRTLHANGVSITDEDFALLFDFMDSNESGCVEKVRL